MKRWFFSWLLILLIGLAPLYPQSARVVGRSGVIGVTRVHQASPGIPDPLLITTASPDLDTGTEQSAYSDTLAATGGTTPYVWTLEPESTLPPGLSLATDGTISGTPTAEGDYPFTVRVDDDGGLFKTAVLSIQIDPLTPSDPVLFTYSEETDMTGFATPGGSSVTSTGLIDGSREVTKTSATVTVWDTGWNVPEVFIGFDAYRPADGLSPATSRYQAVACYDTSNNVLLQCGPETDWDYFCKTPGQTTFSGRGFFAQPLTSGVSKNIRLRLKKGTGADAELDMSVDGAASQTFAAGTITTNIDRCSFVDDNDSAGDFPYDRIFARSDAWEAYVPPEPGGSGSPGTTLLSSYGTVCTGTGDDGPEIEAAFADRANWVNDTLEFPPAAICQVNEKLTNLGGKSGYTIEGNGSTIFAANGLTIEDATALVHIVDGSGFSINRLTIDGNRANRAVRETAGGDNLRLLDVQDATFTTLVSKNGCNDSGRVAASNRASLSTYPENLTFTDSKFDNGFRNSMSVIEGWNIRFLGECTGTFTGTCTCQFTGANGASPEAGLDIEPNPNGDPSYPFTEDIEVDGCQFSGNRRRGYLNVTQWDADDSSNARDRNHTVRNSIFKSNGNATANNSDGHMSIAAGGTLVENNYFDAPLSIRFGVIYVTGGRSDASPLNPARNIQIINNFFDGNPPTGWGVAGTPGRFIHWGNIFPVGSPYATGANANTGEYKNNTHTNTSHTTTSDWCSPGVAGNESSGGMSGNILPNGTVSGCP